jgi:WD40 repeat protein
MQDVKNRSQTILQGHISPITAICSCADRAMVVTADGGNDSILVAWSTASAQPLFTAAHPHGHGILCMDISQDGSKLVTISKPPEPGAAQYISLWDISSRARAECAISVLIPAGDEQVGCCSCYGADFQRCYLKASRFSIALIYECKSQLVLSWMSHDTLSRHTYQYCMLPPNLIRAQFAHPEIM